MNMKRRKTALFAVFFVFVRGVALPIGRAEGTDSKAGTPQIKSSSSELELLKSTSFDLQSTTVNDDLTISNNFLQLSRSMVEILPTSLTLSFDSISDYMSIIHIPKIVSDIHQFCFVPYMHIQEQARHPQNA